MRVSSEFQPRQAAAYTALGTFPEQKAVYELEPCTSLSNVADIMGGQAYEHPNGFGAPLG